jgi:hypothetical protein
MLLIRSLSVLSIREIISGYICESLAVADDILIDMINNNIIFISI